MATPFHFGSCSAMAMAQTRGQAAESFRPDRLAVAVESNQAPTSFYGDQLLLLRRSVRAPGCVQKTGRRRSEGPLRRKGGVGIKCALQDLIGGDLLKFDLGQWLDDVEKHKALAIYSPHEGGYEGRYLTRLRYQGYYFLDLSARGLGDPEATLTKIHPVCPSTLLTPYSNLTQAHLGRQPIARWYYPPEIDYRLSLLPPDSKGLILWVIEAKVLSKAELQFLALLPSIRPKVKVIAECGNWRKFVWKPLKEIAGLPLDDEA
ncbi:NAD(P)H-quinone oxidoreductase subunit N [Nymphaea thermarum]|nr:NAD(P)H-quinone oxidoreductase subunit N [Nymphaea thermarum]